MCAEKKGSEHGILWSVFANKCPRCRQGDLFINPNPYNLKSTMTMPEACPVCGQRFELQTGFYFGTGFVSYGLAVMLSAVTFAIWWFTIGMGIQDNRVFWWLIVNAALLVLLQPLIQRFSRSVWITFFVRYDKDWTIHNHVML